MKCNKILTRKVIKSAIMTDQRKKFASTLRQLIEQSEQSGYRAPISGNCGEECLGYITDPAGRLYRLQKQYKTDADIGPGSYSPQMSKPKGRTIGVRHSEPEKKRILYPNRPAFYNYEEKRTKILHYIPEILQEDILNKKRKRTALEEEEEDTDEEPEIIRIPNPKVLHPCYNYKLHPKKEKTEEEKKKELKLLAKKEKEAQKHEILKLYPTKQDSEIPATAAWANQTGRTFPDIKPSFVPDPGAYTLPDTIGRGNGYKFRPRVKETPKKKIEISPAPNQYDPYVVHKKEKDVSRNSTRPKDFTLSAPKNLKKPDPLPPGPCEFQKYVHPLSETGPRTILSRHSVQHEDWQNISEDTPGPGKYDLKSSFDKPRAQSSVVPRKPISQSDTFPNPPPTFY